MKASCRRWVDIGDRAAIGEAIAAEDARFRRDHVAKCEPCAREAGLWSVLEGCAGEPVRDTDVSPEIVARILRFARRGPRPSGAVVAVSLLALAAAVALIVRGRATSSIDGMAQARLAVGAGEAWVDGKRGAKGDLVPMGASVRAGARVCLDIEKDVQACLAAGSEARFADATLAHRVLELRHGHLDASLGHQPNGCTFSVDTPKGKVTAVGTAFSVDVPDGDGPVVVRVQNGVVVVRPRTGPEQRVAAGEQTVLAASAGDKPAVAEAMPSSSASAPPAVVAPAPPGSVSAVPAGRGAVHTSAADLLARARTLRQEGRFREAADAYRDLEAAYPASGEAHASLVSLGDLEVSQLGDAASALHAFDAYLATGGALAEEAAFGRIGALRSLGRAAEQKQAIEEFLVRYPGSMHGDALRSRLGVP